MDRQALNFVYKQNLEQDIIHYLADLKGIDLRLAMDIYYQSKLARQIEQGLYGIENLDYKYLVQDLLENEPELFCQK